MHYYSMGTSLQPVKGMHLKATIVLLHPNDNMLSAQSSLLLLFLKNVIRSSKVRSMCTWRLQHLALQVMSGPTSRMAPLWSRMAPLWAKWQCQRTAVCFWNLCQQGSKDMTTNSLLGTSVTSFATTWHINNICRHSDRQHFHKQEGMEAVAWGAPILILPWLLFSWTASPCQGHYCSIQYTEEQQRGGNISNRLPLWDNASGYQQMQGCCQVLPQQPCAKVTTTGTAEDNGSPRSCLSSADSMGYHSADEPDPHGF